MKRKKYHSEKAPSFPARNPSLQKKILLETDPYLPEPNLNWKPESKKGRKLPNGNGSENLSSFKSVNGVLEEKAVKKFW
jgi:hypothetical protein